MSSSEGRSAGSSEGLFEEVRRAIDALRPRYPTSEALLLPALHIAQRLHGGWLPDPAINGVAELLDLAPAKVYGVVTFYDLFHQRPVGHHRIRVCTNLSCALRGANEVLAAIGGKLGVDEDEVTGDGRLSYTHFECLGACEQAPMMMINDRYHGNLTPDSAASLIEALEKDPR